MRSSCCGPLLSPSRILRVRLGTSVALSPTCRPDALNIPSAAPYFLPMPAVEVSEASAHFGHGQCAPGIPKIATPPMISRASSLNAVVCAALAALALATSASAQTASERECRAVMATQTSAYEQRVLRVIAQCHRKRAAGRIPFSVGCNSVHQADARGRLDARRVRVHNAIAALD